MVAKWKQPHSAGLELPVDKDQLMSGGADALMSISRAEAWRNRDEHDGISGESEIDPVTMQNRALPVLRKCPIQCWWAVKDSSLGPAD
jgi:hypothetical protein